MILIDFIAAHKCVFLYAARSTLFLIGLFLFTQLFQAIQKMESELFSFASTFLLVIKYKINNHKLHTMFTKLVQLFFLPCFGYSHYPFKPIKANLQFKRHHGRWLLQLHSLGQYFLSVNIPNWMKPSGRPRGCNWGHEGKTKENEQKPASLSGRVSALFFFFVHPMFSYLCKIKRVCRTLTTFHGPK